MVRLIALIAAFTLGLLALVGCQRPAPAAPAAPRPTPPPPAVRVAKVERAELARTAGYTGDVRATNQVVVLPKVAGRIEKLSVEVGSAVKAGEVIAELERATLETQVAQAEAAVGVAEAKLAAMRNGPRPELVAQAAANLRMARARLAALRDGGRTEAIGQAQANLDAARARLAQLRAGATPQQVKAAELLAQQYRNALYAAQLQRDGVCGNRYNPRFLCDAEQARVNAAETAAEQAEQQVKVITSPPTAEQVAQAEAAVAAAEQQLALARNPITSHDLAQAEAAVAAAEQQHQLAQKPFTDEDLRAASAGLDQAKAGLELARLQRKEATITAPIDGIVTERHLSVGATAAPTTPIVTLVGREVKVTTSVEESRLGDIQVGQPATLLVAAYPGQPFAAKVKSIAPVVESRSRTIAIDLAPDDPRSQLKPGMFVQVQLETARKKDVLVVPKAAIVEQSGMTALFVVGDGVLRRLEVRTGIVDGDRVEVLEGVAEGQEVVVGGRPDLRDGDAVTAQRG
ncbi:MAG: efflux RND transporter periplasmic adaptor subunit [Chloroflexi bacterium]|nr:efflux RND transporter periplasmic adaptor subunit [Chloroflexota bacterium]